MAKQIKLWRLIIAVGFSFSLVSLMFFLCSIRFWPEEYHLITFSYEELLDVLFIIVIALIFRLRSIKKDELRTFEEILKLELG